ncbi:hypothetical protein GQ457_03G020520 [Hibiscus cannabinus]
MSLLWHMQWRYEAPKWSTACMVWSARAWPPESPWIRRRSTDAGRGAIDRHGRMWWILTSVFNAGLLILFLNSFIGQAFHVLDALVHAPGCFVYLGFRSLDSLLIWSPFVPWMKSCIVLSRRFSSVFCCPCGCNLWLDPHVFHFLRYHACPALCPCLPWCDKSAFLASSLCECLVCGPGTVARGYAMFATLVGPFYTGLWPRVCRRMPRPSLFSPFVVSILHYLARKLPLLGRLVDVVLLDTQVSLLFHSSTITRSLYPGDLNFTAEEQDAIVVVLDTVAIHAKDFACSLVGRVLTSGPLDGGRLAHLFHNVLKRGPWEFQKQWFALELVDPTRTIHDYLFHYMSIWVRINNIPLSLMMEALARTLGACIRKMVMTDTRLEDDNMGEFLRVRISLDNTKPLRRCVTLSRPDTKAILRPLQYERIPIFCHGCGLIGHVPLQCPTTPQVDCQKHQYGAWLRAPQPNWPVAARLRGRVAIVNDEDLSPHSPAPSVSSSPRANASVVTASVPAPSASVGPVTFVAPLASGCDTVVSAPLPAHVARDNEAPYDPMLHPDVSNAMEDSLEVPNDCILFTDLDGMVQSAGMDPVNDVINEAMDALIRDVASSILGRVSASPAISSTMVATVAACSFPLLSASRPALTCARRLSMPHVPEQDDFEVWYAA